jgi:PAS domain S-box-containing protein
LLRWWQCGTGDISLAPESPLVTNQPAQVESIRKKVLIPLGITLAALFCIFLLTLSALRYRENKQDLALQQASVQSLFHHLVASQANLLTADAHFLSRQPELQQAMAVGDRAALLAGALPYFQNLLVVQGLSHLYFHTPEGNNFLRVHRPEEYGDTISRFTLGRARADGQIAHGLELGPLGTYTLRLVYPWRRGDELLGYIELGEGIDSLIQRLHDSAQVELVITLLKSNLQRQAWEGSMQRAGRTPHWEDFDELVVVDSTLPHLDQFLPRNGQKSEWPLFSQVSSNGHTYQVGLLPLHDAGQRLIGNFVVFRDISENMALYYRSLLITVLACLVLGGGLFLSCWLILGRTDRHLVETRVNLLQEMERTRRINSRLETEVEDHRLTESALQQTRARLEETVQERTLQLQAALEETRQAHDQVSAILRSVHDALFVTDHHGQMILLNNRAEQLLGVRQEEAFGVDIAKLITYPELLEQVRKVLAGMVASPFDVDVANDDTPPVTLRIRTSRVESAQGAIGGMIFLAQDVSLEKEMDRMKNEFISTAAHELNTPLATILGFAELLMSDDDFSPEERQEFIGYIFEKADHLTQLVGELLDLSRIEAGRPLEMHKKICRVDELFAGALRHYQTAYSERFRFSLGDPDLQLSADRVKIHQVLENLLSNAFKYSPQGGKIQASGARHAQEYSFSIRDEGIGMTEEQVARIFEKFYRADASNTAIPGTGLGMTIVRNIIVAHGGSIVVESAPAQGTTVRFTLPLASIDAEQSTPLPSFC